ncbi:MAG: hypothetical protein DRR19_25320 [Candidatus Parabeggiatoa sp. nov. 1]|nr:MAG: hypothetical protein DRR19_25320 [Gammaproteobacteria bacterium]
METCIKGCKLAPAQLWIRAIAFIIESECVNQLNKGKRLMPVNMNTAPLDKPRLKCFTAFKF